MPMETWPRTMKAGRFKGRTFGSRAEYDAAKNSTVRADDAAPLRSSLGGPSSAKPKLQYSKAMVEAVIKMIEGGLSFLPLFRGQLVGEGDAQHFERAITPEEYDWLVGDWYAFGKRHPFFARLIVQLFTVDLYGQLALDHVVIVGARLIAVGSLPQQAIFPLQMAYVLRQTMAGEIAATIEAEPEQSDLGVAPGGSPGVGGSDEYGENVPSPPSPNSAASHDYVLHETR